MNKVTMKIYGLIGNPIEHSFSQVYFTEKFRDWRLSDVSYQLYKLEDIKGLESLIQNTQELHGLNVTLPYKSVVLPLLTKIHPDAQQIGAVNCIRIDRKGKHITTTGFNTDIWGFEQSLLPVLKPHHKKALILGTGGSSKAVAFVLSKLGIAYTYISRTPRSKNQIQYANVTDSMVEENKLIINTTPLGMFPLTKDKADIPYFAVGEQHLLYDLVYNPEESSFLSAGKRQGSQIKNGLEMLYAQAEKSWEVWSDR